MKTFLIRNQTRIPWALAALGFIVLVYLLFSINISTGKTVGDIESTITKVENGLEKERQLREERLIGYTTCLLKTPLEQRTDLRIADCREASGLTREAPMQPPIETTAGTEPSAQGGAQPSQPLGDASSYSNPAPPAEQPQSEISQPQASQPVPPQQQTPQQTILSNLEQIINPLLELVR